MSQHTSNMCNAPQKVFAQVLRREVCKYEERSLHLAVIGAI